MRYGLITCCFILLILSTAYADIYKYVDDNGVMCYTDTPLNKKTSRVIKDTPAQENQLSENNYKPDYHSIIRDKATVYNIDPSLIKAVIETESNWNSRAISKKGAMGLMQLMPATASELDVNNPFDPEENIEGGTKYLKYLLGRFKGDLTLALAAYNAGPKVVEKFGIVPPITETRQYVSKVLSKYNGKTFLSTENGSAKKKEKSEKIYKIILKDGSVLFTNSSFVLQNPSRL
jgi:hypothetical protein